MKKRSSASSFSQLELIADRSTQRKKSRFSSAFTLIELLVVTSQHCRHFIHNSCFASAKTYSLFLKGEWGLGKGENLFSREKKFFPSPEQSPPCRERGAAAGFIFYKKTGQYNLQIFAGVIYCS